MFNLNEFIDKKLALETIYIDGDQWFFLEEVCESLAYYGDRDKLIDLISSRDGNYDELTIVDEPGEAKAIIDLRGLFIILMHDNSKITDDFMDWLTKDVLPKCGAMEKMKEIFKFKPIE